MAQGDNIERLDCVYYSGPIPANVEILTTLCFVYDKIYFPAVDLPLGGFDQKEVQKEIVRLQQLGDRSFETEQLIGALKFLSWRIPLDGILEYPSPKAALRSTDENISKIVRAIYDANYESRENFEPMFTTGHSKALPGGDGSINYAGDLNYLAEAISFSAASGIPMIDDGSSFPFPFKARYKDQVPSLISILAIESIQAAMPMLPVLTPQEIVEFRMENVKELRNFRAAMLRLASTLNGQLAEGSTAEELRRKGKFIIDTQVVPALHELRRDLESPNRAWYKRLVDGVGIAASVGIGCLAAGTAGGIAGGIIGSSVTELKRILLSEADAGGAKIENIKRNGLYYLIRAQAKGR